MIQNEESSSEQNVPNRLRGNGNNVSNGNDDAPGNGDEILPRICNRHKMEQNSVVRFNPVRISSLELLLYMHHGTTPY